jgi:hypothetical protein
LRVCCRVARSSRRRNRPQPCPVRHCPKCQGAAAREWLAEREAELLPVPYFHVVFSLPVAAGQNRPNKAAIYDILFKASAEKPLNHNPHVHMIVPGGGISRDGARWVACRPDFLRAPPWAPGGISPPHLSKRRSSSRYKSRMRRAIALASSSPVMQQSFLRRPATARNPGRLSPLLGHYGGPRECRRDKH